MESQFSQKSRKHLNDWLSSPVAAGGEVRTWSSSLSSILREAPWILDAMRIPPVPHIPRTWKRQGPPCSPNAISSPNLSHPTSKYMPSKLSPAAALWPTPALITLLSHWWLYHLVHPLLYHFYFCLHFGVTSTVSWVIHLIQGVSLISCVLSVYVSPLFLILGPCFSFPQHAVWKKQRLGEASAAKTRQTQTWASWARWASGNSTEQVKEGGSQRWGNPWKSSYFFMRQTQYVVHE